MKTHFLLFSNLNSLQKSDLKQRCVSDLELSVLDVRKTTDNKMTNKFYTLEIKKILLKENKNNNGNVFQIDNMAYNIFMLSILGILM